MLESNYSKQVAQPYFTHDTPPNKRSHYDEDLFKTVTFQEDNPNLKIRLVSVDHNGVRMDDNPIEQKEVFLPLESQSRHHVRVQAVLKESINGISKSHWVKEDEVDLYQADILNQARIKGVSLKGYESNWVYSNLKDDENQDVLFNMIHDVLDLLLTLHDDQVDYLMDYLITDVFSTFLKENAPEYQDLYDFEFIKEMKAAEHLRVDSTDNLEASEAFIAHFAEHLQALSGYIKKAFTEEFMVDSKEFAQLLRSYKLLDQFQSEKQDFFTLLVESFLEDHYEQIVKKANMEVILSNDEETSVYLNSSYDFDVKSELISSLYQATLDDRFVSRVNDAVELITDMIILEDFHYKYDEAFENFFRMALFDLYFPILALDQHLVRLDIDVNDTYDDSIYTNLLEFSTTTDGVMNRHMLVSDVLEAAIKGDLTPAEDYHLKMVDLMLNMITKSEKTILVEYFSEEVFKVILDVGESFRQGYTHYIESLDENIQIQLLDTLSQEASSKAVFDEKVQSKLNDEHQLSDLTDSSDMNESKVISMLGDIKKEADPFQTHKEHITMNVADRLKHKKSILQQIKNKLHVQFNDALSKESMKDKKDFVFYTVVQHTEQLESNDMQHLYTHHADMKTDIKDDYHLLYKPMPKSVMKYPSIEKKVVAVHSDLKDYFFIDGEEDLKYTLGDIGSDWPIGEFIIGTHRLRGEVSTT